MKTLLLTLLLLPALCYAQVKKPAPRSVSSTPRQSPTMNGIGTFKIGLTSVKDVASFCAKSSISLQSSYSLQQSREAGDSTVAFIVPYESPDDYADASYLASPCPEVTVIYFPLLTISTVEIREVALRFYNDKLIEINTSSPGELAEAFELKYGAPITTSLTKASKCIYRLTGNKVVYQDKTFFGRWYNGGVVAESYLSKSRNAKCEEEYSQQFSVRDQAKVNLVASKENVLRRNAAVKNNAVKRKNLSEL